MLDLVQQFEAVKLSQFVIGQDEIYRRAFRQQIERLLAGFSGFNRMPTSFEKPGKANPNVAFVIDYQEICH